MAIRRCGVLGSPIGHSLSPVLHLAAYRQLGLEWSYTAHEVREDELAAFVADLDPSWRGLSLTMPLKRVALDVADRSTDIARQVGAANTLVIEPDGTLSADNTDVPGLVAALQGAPSYQRGSAACVWGGGATAASTLAALRSLGVDDVHLHVRQAERAAPTRKVAAALGLSVDVRSWRVDPPSCACAELVVSTVPSGAADAVADDIAAHAQPGKVLFDVAYDPWPSLLAAAWEKHGGAVVSGLDLLVHQAAGQVRLMTGRNVPPSVLYAAVS